MPMTMPMTVLPLIFLGTPPGGSVVLPFCTAAALANAVSSFAICFCASAACFAALASALAATLAASSTALALAAASLAALRSASLNSSTSAFASATTRFHACSSARSSFFCRAASPLVSASISLRCRMAARASTNAAAWRASAWRLASASAHALALVRCCEQSRASVVHAFVLASSSLPLWLPPLAASPFAAAASPLAGASPPLPAASP
mmetsp:Transcript_67017/g.183810  ORF Transcript_67017/g.183810 Transcript_67017/m.183810 type:complete len:209 (-) Transcript_67017:668-1294(-)